jgi:hypothetical protein
MGCSFNASAKPGFDVIEVDQNRRIDNTSAHELGHILLGPDSHCHEVRPHADCVADGDLMTDGPHPTYQNITRCEKAKKSAKNFSERYRKYSKLVQTIQVTPHECCSIPRSGGGEDRRLLPVGQCDELLGTPVTDGSSCTPIAAELHDGNGAPLGVAPIQVCCVLDDNGILQDGIDGLETRYSDQCSGTFVGRGTCESLRPPCSAGVQACGNFGDERCPGSSTCASGCCLNLQ